MALVGLVGGSFIGAICGMFGWLLFGLGFLQAIAVYFAVAMLTPVALILVAGLLAARQSADQHDGERADALAI